MTANLQHSVMVIIVSYAMLSWATASTTTETPTTTVTLSNTDTPTTGVKATDTPASDVETTVPPTTSAQITDTLTTGTQITNTSTTGVQTTDMPTTSVQVTVPPTTGVQTTDKPTTDVQTGVQTTATIADATTTVAQSRVTVGVTNAADTEHMWSPTSETTLAMGSSTESVFKTSPNTDISTAAVLGSDTTNTVILLTNSDSAMTETVTSAVDELNTGGKGTHGSDVTVTDGQTTMITKTDDSSRTKEQSDGSTATEIIVSSSPAAATDTSSDSLSTVQQTCITGCEDTRKVCAVSENDKGKLIFICVCGKPYLPVSGDGCVHEDLVIGLTAGLVGGALVILLILVIVLAIKYKSTAKELKMKRLIIDNSMTLSTSRTFSSGRRKLSVHDMELKNIRTHPDEGKIQYNNSSPAYAPSRSSNVTTAPGPVPGQPYRITTTTATPRADIRSNQNTADNRRRGETVNGVTFF